MPDRSFLASFTKALEEQAADLGLQPVDKFDKNPHIVRQRGDHLVVRDRGASFSRGDGITAVFSWRGDELFNPSKTLLTLHFDVEVVDGKNVWREEGSAFPTYADGELARALLNRPI
jgi:hypothetical protein